MFHQEGLFGQEVLSWLKEVMKTERRLWTATKTDHDGGWDEGPGYWAYATQYNIFYLSALQTALGTDFGFDKQPGF